MKELRKALFSFMFSGLFIAHIYKLYNEKIEAIDVIEMVGGYTSIILIIFGFYQLFKFFLYICYKKRKNILVIEYNKELWSEFVKDEIKRKLADNLSKLKKTLMIIPLISICLFLAFFEFRRKDAMIAEGMFHSPFQIGILTVFMCIIVFALIWYGMAPLLFYIENIYSRRPFVMADKNYVLLNGELYRWKNEKDNHIVERKILNGDVVQIRYQTSSARFNDVTFRFLIPPDRKDEVARYIRMI